MLRTIFATLFVLSLIAAAQQAPTVSQHYKPGDTIHYYVYYVRFAGDPVLHQVSLQFLRQVDDQKGPPPRPPQPGMRADSNISQSKKISPGVYEVNGTIRNDMLPGTWRLNQIRADHPPVYQAYIYPADFTDKIMIEIVNDAGYEFPPVKSVTPNPPK
jgi:hypothetical protein